ncbi:MAG: DNA translocase FtsK 4TM domain-containing protein, partial [Clostridium sp.]
MSRKKTQKNTKQKSKKNIENNNRDIQGIIFIAIGILLTVAIYTNMVGILSTMSQNLANRLLGVGAYFIPPYLLYLGFNFIKSKGEISLSKRFYGVTMVVTVVILVFGTIHLQVIENSDTTKLEFAKELSKIAMGDSNPHAGVIGHLITYPIFKFLGAVGSYILYIAICAVSFIMIFDITLHDLGIKVKSKGKELNDKRRTRVKQEKPREEYLNIVDKSDGFEDKDEFLAGVSNKIKILDFMKNAALEEGDSIKVQGLQDVKEEQEEITTFIES